MPRRVDALSSLAHKEWPWIVFKRDGQAAARGTTRVAAINRYERAEGWCNHGQFALVKHAGTGETWHRIGGSWFPRDDTKGRAA